MPEKWLEIHNENKNYLFSHWSFVTIDCVLYSFTLFRLGGGGHNVPPTGFFLAVLKRLAVR